MELRQVESKLGTKGRGVERVSELYLVEDVIIDGKRSPSAEYLAAMKQADLSPETKELMFRIVEQGLSAVIRSQP